MNLIEILSVAATSSQNVHDMRVMADIGAGPEELPFTLVDGDPHGLAPQVSVALSEWVRAGNPVTPYDAPPAPTQEELRATFPTLTPRQFRLVLIQTGTPLSAVDALISGIADEEERVWALIEWQYASSFSRTHPLIESLGTTLGYSPEQIDTLWSWGATL